MPRRNETNPKKRPIEQYEHKDKKRLNNPPVGLVTPSTDRRRAERRYAYDPHLDPAARLGGQGRAHPLRGRRPSPCTSTSASTRATIVEAVRKKNGAGDEQAIALRRPEENPPLREAIDFYKHAHGWSNRLIAGDSCWS